MVFKRPVNPDVWRLCVLLGRSTAHLNTTTPCGLPLCCCSDLYADAAADGSEPEIRRQLRAARAAEKHAKMKAALAEKQAKEAAEQERRQQQQAHKQAHKDRIEAWKNKNKVGSIDVTIGWCKL